LEPSSLADRAQAADPHIILEGQLRECYGRVVYTHKTHEKCADILLTRDSRIKWAQIVLSTLTTTGVFASIGLGDKGPATAIASGILSAILLILNAYVKDNDLGSLAQKHRQAGADIWLVRERYLSLLTDLVSRTKPLDALQSERDKLLKELHSAYLGSPSTNAAAYQAAQQALQRSEDMTFSDAEIDAFLPAALKRGKKE
jgi:hypothetical protein